MKTIRFFVFLTIFCVVLGHYYDKKKSPYFVRHKRDAVGALDIVTNNAQPIHAEVKPEQSHDITAKVSAPEDTITYQSKSLRKSLPVTNSLEVARSITRAVTLAVLAISAGIEFYPLLKHFYNLIYRFLLPHD